MSRVISVLIYTLAVFNQALACKCSATPPTIEENWGYADQVFIGDVIGIDSSGGLFTKYGESITTFTIKIVETFKSQVDNGYKLRTFVWRGDGSCDYKFRFGERYLIYATDNGRDFFLSTACSRTTHIGRTGNNEIEELRKLHKEPKKREEATKNSENERSSDDVKTVKALNSKLAEDKRMLSLLCSTLGAITIFLIVYVVRRHKTNA